MKIGILAPIDEVVDARKFGGTERIIASLADGLVDKGHQVTLFAAAGSQTKAELVPVSAEPIILAQQRIKDSIYAKYFLEALGGQYQFDLWSNHILSYPLSFGPYLQAPMVTTIHSEALPERTELLQAASASSSFIAISDNQRRSYAGVNIVDTIYNGTDPDALGFGEGKGGYFVWLGRFTPKKGAAEAVEVAARTGIHLKLAGHLPEDPATADHQYYAEHVEPFLSDKIEYVGRVDVAAKAALLQDAIALISPLSWEEPFGLVATEAMSCGTPVLTTKCGAMPEVVKHGVTGYLVDDPKEFDRLTEEVATLDRQAVRQHVIDNFSVQRMIDAYDAAYQKLANA